MSDAAGRASAAVSRSVRLLDESVALARRRRRLARALAALPPVAAAVAASALGALPPAVAALVAAAGLAWMVRATAEESDAGELARRIDDRLAAKDSFLTLATVAVGERSVLWPAVEESASARAADAPPRRFAPPLAWRPALASLAVSLVLLAAVLLAPEARRLLPTTPLAELAMIAGELSADGRDGASRKLGAELRELVAKLEDPAVSDDEKRKLIAEMRQQLEQSEQSQGQGSGQGKSAEGKDSGTSSGAEGKSGEASGGSSKDLQSQAKSALDRADKELQGKGSQQKSESQPGDAGESEPGEGAKGEQKSETAGGGGVQGPREGEQAGDKPSDAPGNQPANQEQKGKSESGEGQSGRESREQPSQREGESGGQSKGASGDGAGAADKPAPSESGEEAERYYKLGDGPDALELRDGAYVRVLVPDSDEGLGVDRVQKPGVTHVETPFGNAPLPSEGPTGSARHSQRLPLEYRPALRPQ